jgi:hypothetical protein
VPDFLGGLVFLSGYQQSASIVKLDGITGQIDSTYTPGGGSVLSPWGLPLGVHTDGTIFAIQQNDTDPVYWLIGIDPATGTQKVGAPLLQWHFPWSEADTQIYGLMIAGDGYAYVPYVYRVGIVDVDIAFNHLMLTRLNSSGASDNIDVFDWTSGWYDMIAFGPVNMITNADQGILLSWAAPGPMFGMAVTTGTSVSLINAPEVPGQDPLWPISPLLQAQDGSFVGTAVVGEDANDNPLTSMISFDQTGNVRWTVPGNYQPQIATADGGLIATDPTGAAVTFDQYGNVTGVQGSLPTISWKGAYQVGSVQSIISDWWRSAKTLAAGITTQSFWAAVGANLTHNGTALVQRIFALNWCANNSCNLTYNPPYGGPGVTDSNVDFHYQMADQGGQPTPSIELSAPQIATVTNAALNALKKAFAGFPAIVVKVEADTPNSTNLVEVSGGVYCTAPGACPAGLTAPNRNASTVWYNVNLSQAQYALNLQDTDLSASTDSPLFANVLWSTGEGIGNTAAHEIAHQFLLETCGMNDDPSLVGVYNGGSADAGDDPSMYTGIGPNGQPLHWSPNTAICLVNMILKNKVFSESNSPPY